MAAAALVLGLLQPLAPSVVLAADAPPVWAQQGDGTSFLEIGTGADAQRYVLHRYDDPTAIDADLVVPAFVTEVEYLVVGGGGGGGERGGGGGAGGVLEGLGGGAMAVTAGQVLPVAVGAGGAPGENGEDSTFGTAVVAVGGGHGGNEQTVDSGYRGGAAGGSGGGGGHSGSVVTTGGTADPTVQGHDGGANGGNQNAPWPAGGGGGAGAAGGDGATTTTQTTAGHGGDGSTSQITGAAVVYGGGGGGQVLYDLDTNGDGTPTFRSDTAAGAGGPGGGGDGGGPCGVTAGVDGLGGGGGGGDTRASTYDLGLCSDASAGAPQPGGSGVVLVRYLADGLVDIRDITAATTSVPAGQDTTVTVTVVDVDGLDAAGVPVTLAADPGGALGPVTTGDDGTATFTVTNDTAAAVAYTAKADGVAMGSSVEVTYTEPATPSEPPAPEEQGAFRISSYAGSGIGETASRWWRGYVFTVAEETTVTHLVGSGTYWSTVGLFEAEVTGSGDAATHVARIQDQEAWNGASTNAGRLDALALGWVLIEGDVTDEPMALEVPVTLTPGTEYLLAQSAATLDGTYEEAHHNRYVERIDRDDLLRHPRIGDLWIPEDDHSLRWNGEDARTIAGARDGVLVDSNELMPLVGFLYDSAAAAPAVTTADPATAPFAGTLTDTGGSATTVCIDVGETEAVYERRCVDVVAADATAGGGSVDVALHADDLAGFGSGTLRYRAVAVNEVGVALGGWRSAYHAAGTLITTQAFTTSMPDADAGWRFRSQPPAGALDSDYPSIRDGHLRLVPAEPAWSGSAIYDVAQPTSAGLDVSFRTTQFGGTGADGLAFFLADGATQDIVPGNSGGRLGYVNLGDEDGAGALLGIGLDTYGNFATEQTTGCPEIYGPTPNALTIRGGAADDWCVLTPPVPITEGWQTERLVRIQIDPGDAAAPEVRVSLDGSQVASFPQPASLRAVSTFRFGFTASTGGSTNNHDVWDVEVRSLIELPPVRWDTLGELPGAVRGSAYRARLGFVDAVAPATVSVVDGTLPDGLALTGTAIAGTPTTVGTSAITLEVADGRTPASTATRAFTLTVDGNLASVATATPSAVTVAAARVGGSITDAGGVAVGARGFVLVAGQGVPTLADRVAAAPLEGAFEVEVDGLEPSTLYQVRAYATNAIGTAYGATMTLTTLEEPPSPPPPPAEDPEPEPSEEPEPVRDEAGTLPAPGETQAEIGGQRTAVGSEPTTTGGRRVTGEAFVLEVEPVPVDGEAPDDGATPPADDEGPVDEEDGPGGGTADGADADLVFTRGQAAQVRVRGFQPGSSVRLWLFSEPQLLGEFRTDGAGSLQAVTEVLGDHISACRHSLHAEGVLPDGRTIRLSIGVWVDAVPYPFGDVSTGSVHRRAIACLYDSDIVRGTSAGTFAPSGTTTRGQVASMFARAFGLETTAAPTHADVVGTTHAEAIAALVEAGVAHGFDADTFGPDRPVTRGQFASMLAVLLDLPVDGAEEVGARPAPDEGAPPSDGPSFPDMAGVHAGAIAALAGSGLITGFDDGTFGPSKAITRAQSASIIVRQQLAGQ